MSPSKPVSSLNQGRSATLGRPKQVKQFFKVKFKGIGGCIEFHLTYSMK